MVLARNVECATCLYIIRLIYYVKIKLCVCVRLRACPTFACYWVSNNHALFSMFLSMLPFDSSFFNSFLFVIFCIIRIANGRWPNVNYGGFILSWLNNPFIHLEYVCLWFFFDKKSLILFKKSVFIYLDNFLKIIRI